MIKLIKDKGYLIFAVLFLASIAPLTGRFFPHEQNIDMPGDELFDPSLSRLNTLNKVIAYTDSLYESTNPAVFDTVAYVHTLSKVIKKRFYHGISYYTPSQNWIAAASGKLFWRHLAAVVDPDDILKSSKGLCSQQSIIFLEGMRRKGITSRSVGLGYKEGPGHFLTEVYYGSDWHLYDVTIEPKWSASPENKHKSMDFYMNHKEVLAAIYEGKIQKNIFDKIVQKVSYGEPGQFPAKKMRFFHKATDLATYALPLFFLALSVRAYRKKATRHQAAAPKAEHVATAPLKEEPAVLLQ